MQYHYKVNPSSGQAITTLKEDSQQAITLAVITSHFRHKSFTFGQAFNVWLLAGDPSGGPGTPLPCSSEAFSTRLNRLVKTGHLLCRPTHWPNHWGWKAPPQLASLPSTPDPLPSSSLLPSSSADTTELTPEELAVALGVDPVTGRKITK